MAGQVKIVPNTFAMDEKTSQGLVIFETLTTKTKFSVYLGSNVEVGLFLRESFKRQESGFVLSKKIIESMGYKIDRGFVKELNGDHELVQLILKDGKKTKRLSVSLLELVGMWTLENFPMYTNSNLIENCRDVKVEVKETSKPLRSDLFKRYGQKYLM